MGESKQKKAKSGLQADMQSRTTGDRIKSSKIFQEMTYGKPQFKWMLIGVGFIVLGLILMSGGGMPSPDVWDESIIYSARRITVAPICILIGLGLQIYAIFKMN